MFFTLAFFLRFSHNYRFFYVKLVYIFYVYVYVYIFSIFYISVRIKRKRKLCFIILRKIILRILRLINIFVFLYVIVLRLLF